MKLFRFFLFFFQQPVCFFFLRYDLDTSTGTDEVEVRIYWNTPPFFSLNSFHAFLDKLRKTFPPFFFLFATRLSLHRNRTKTENRIFRITYFSNQKFPPFYTSFRSVFEFCFILMEDICIIYIKCLYERKFRVKNCAKLIEKCEQCYLWYNK